MIERMLWMLDELRQAILHLEKARAFWEQEEMERHGELIRHRELPVKCLDCRNMVGGDGIEPSTSAMSTRCSASELTALVRDKTVTTVLGTPLIMNEIAAAVSVMSKEGESIGDEGNQ